MDEMIKMLALHKLTPNQFFFLYGMRDGMTIPFLNVGQELRVLKHDGWVLQDNQLTSKAKRVVAEIEGLFKRTVKKTNSEIMGADFNSKMQAYNQLWPKRRLPSGKAARSAIGNIEPCFRWFFQNYEHDWITVLKATAYYLDEQEKQGYKFCRTSQYFIRKQNNDKSFSSDLADYCILVTGDDMAQDDYFEEKVFS